MNDLQAIISSVRTRRSKPKDPREYVSFWVEKDVIDDKIVDAFVMILRTKGCFWALNSGCSMCGYINDAALDGVSENDLMYQFENIMKNYSDEKTIKIFTSGSFLDEREVPQTVYNKIFDELASKTDRIIIESRPEYVVSEKLEGRKNLEVAMGLESASDFILENSINKGFKFADYKKAAGLLKSSGLGVKTYLMIKPPFLTESDAITDAIQSAERIKEYTQTISFNPVNIQRYTLVERLWRNGEYRTPWLWSVVEVLMRTKDIRNVRIMSSPTGGGTKRGAHNCGICDNEILKGIEDFSLTQDISYLENLNCGCKNLWQDILQTEKITMAQGDLLRLI
jgi:radical SAM enzyme (TIGR01210 family)